MRSSSLYFQEVLHRNRRNYLTQHHHPQERFHDLLFQTSILGNVLRWIATDILVLIECVYLTLPIYLRNNIATCLNSWHIRFATCPILIEIEFVGLTFLRTQTLVSVLRRGKRKSTKLELQIFFPLNKRIILIL